MQNKYVLVCQRRILQETEVSGMYLRETWRITWSHLYEPYKIPSGFSLLVSKLGNHTIMTIYLYGDDCIVFSWQVLAGGMHTACLLQSGEIYTFGCNDEGALGRDTSEEDSEYSPGKLQSDLRFVQISAGDSHTVRVWFKIWCLKYLNIQSKTGDSVQQRWSPIYLNVELFLCNILRKNVYWITVLFFVALLEKNLRHPAKRLSVEIPKQHVQCSTVCAGHAMV